MPSQPICPWWMRFALFTPLRGAINNPERFLAVWVKPGMVVADIGCGTGFLTLPLARLVGRTGKVIAIDLQPEMLEYTRQSAQKEMLENRIVFQLAHANSIGSLPALDFAVTAWMLHEVPDPKHLLVEIQHALKPGGNYLFFEPILHVSKKAFKRSCDLIESLGFQEISRPPTALSHAILFQKPVSAK
jgi:ubiquinone/menaquinone biosynthesis C-methylase UbiE